MAGLGSYIEQFLVADGFTITAHTPGEIAASRTDAGATARRRLWYVDPDNGVGRNEADLLAAFAGQKAEGGAVQAFFVAPSLAGLTTAFRQKASELGVGVRVPIQLFDTPYKADGDDAFGSSRSSDARSVIAGFLRENRAAIEVRVPQPFVALSGLGGDRGGFASGPDLLGPLVAELAEPPEAPGITVIIGNAGAGKSVLFASLFAALHRHFTDEKRAQRLASRPILFLPAHIRAETGRSLDSLLEAVASTDAAAPTRPGLMRWLNHNGLTVWMFDGLDEFFAGEADFMAALEQGLADGSHARVVICARDSLLTTSTALRSLIDRHMPTGRVKVYELARWERASQRSLAWLRRTGRLPGVNDTDPPAVTRFLAALDGSPALAELATLPFYCDLLLDLETRSPQAAPADELDLLERAVDGLIDREAAKLAAGEAGFDWDVFSGAETLVDAGELVAALGQDAFESTERRNELLQALQTVGRARLVELVEGLAHHMRMLEPYPNQGSGLATGDLEQLAQFYLDIDLPEGLEPRVLLALVQLAFFGPGAETGQVRFAHEIVADYLAARHALAIIKASPESGDALGQALGVRRDLDRSVILRYLVREIPREAGLAELIAAHVAQGRVRPKHAENAAVLASALAGRRG